MEINEIKEYIDKWEKDFIPMFDEEYSKGCEDVINSYDYKYNTFHFFIEKFLKVKQNNIMDFNITQPLDSPFLHLYIKLKNNNYFHIKFDKAFEEFKIDYGNIIIIFINKEEGKTNKEKSFTKATKDIQEVLDIIKKEIKI